ncbi:MAG: CopG family transcriptional regulator [Pseudomonadota bacterium]|nr:CopG family transcriptional regulator [Pseudomonadota bacterium]
MKNVTITMEDGVAEWVRMEAARRNTSVSRLVGEMLAEKLRHDDAYDRAMNEWSSRTRTWKSNGKTPANRAETHDRRLR